MDRRAGLAVQAALLVMSQYALQQQMDEIVGYLELINEKVDDILRGQKDAVLPDMIALASSSRMH